MDNKTKEIETMKKAIGYIRVSTSKQKELGISLEAQEQKMLA